ncbi:MAG: hypothetical protein ACLFQP_11785 [Halothece sp.]
MNEINENQDIKDAVLGGEMTNQNKFRRNPKLQPDDVISVEGSNVRRGIIPNHNTFKFSEIEEQVLPKILQNSEIRQLQEGVEVGVLSPHQPWRKGKLKLKIECELQFIPEEES